MQCVDLGERCGDPRSVFRRLLREQPTGRYELAGCSKDGSGEGPPPKTPPPPPPPSALGGDDFRLVIERAVQDVTQGQMLLRVKPGAGFFGISRSPIEFVQPGLAAAQDVSQKRAFMVTYSERGEIDEERLPELLLEHALHLRRISDEGVLEAVASYAAGTHGVQIVLTDTKEEAERLAEKDPLLVEGYYRAFDIVELVKSVIGDC